MIRDSIWKPFVAFASLFAALGFIGLRDDLMAQPASREIVLVALGDSLTAGYQLPPDAAFPVQLEKALKSRGANVKVINGGVSGDTATEGLARLDWALPDNADAVILELGANDALRGIPVSETTRVMTAIMERLKEKKLRCCSPAWKHRAIGGQIMSPPSGPCTPSLPANMRQCFTRFFLTAWPSTTR